MALDVGDSCGRPGLAAQQSLAGRGQTAQAFHDLGRAQTGRILFHDDEDAGVIGAAATVFERSLDALLGSG